MEYSYNYVRDKILNMIKNGDLPGNRLNSEGELVDMLGTSRATIREVLRSLEMEGILTKRHGVGTFVHPQVLNIPLRIDQAVDFSHMIGDLGMEFGMLSLGGRNFGTLDHSGLKPYIRERLETEETDKMRYMSFARIYTANRRPVAICHLNFPENRFGDKLAGSTDMTFHGGDRLTGSAEMTFHGEDRLTRSVEMTFHGEGRLTGSEDRMIQCRDKLNGNGDQAFHSGDRQSRGDNDIPSGNVEFSNVDDFCRKYFGTPPDHSLIFLCAENADQETANRLEIETNTAVQVWDELLYDYRGELLGYSRIYFSPVFPAFAMLRR